jgi:hypothetical protein
MRKSNTDNTTNRKKKNWNKDGHKGITHFLSYMSVPEYVTLEMKKKKTAITADAWIS